MKNTIYFILIGVFAAILDASFEKCVSCGAPIIKKGNRKKYCDKCAASAYKKQQFQGFSASTL